VELPRSSRINLVSLPAARRSIEPHISTAKRARNTPLFAICHYLNAFLTNPACNAAREDGYEQRHPLPEPDGPGRAELGLGLGRYSLQVASPTNGCELIGRKPCPGLLECGAAVSTDTS
jgi:hypothetical protein